MNGTTYWGPRFATDERAWVLKRGDEIARNQKGEIRRFTHRRSAQTAANTLNAGVRFDWSTIDWYDADAPDPRQDAKDWRNWRYYASPTMTSTAGKNYAPREFRAGTHEAARRIIAASPENRGTITHWSEHTQRRSLVETVDRPPLDHPSTAAPPPG